MADQHNSNIPAVGNTIAADIPDIKENLEFHKDAFQRIFATWSDSDNSAAKLSTTPGFNDGTYNITFPTNPAAGLGHAKIMTGTSDTVIWMYLNTAPPGWKALATGADMVLAISGGAAAYNVNGGNPDSAAVWGITGIAGAAHTHTGPNHTHTGTTTDGYTFTAPSITAGSGSNSQIMNHTHDFTTNLSGNGNTGAASATTVTSDGSWRPKASVGKLFQMDTA
jgi:hypothetical protein